MTNEPATRPVREVGAADLAYRPARSDELATCAEIWRSSLNDYMGRLNLPEIPPELGPITRLYAHLQATDPARFVVGLRQDQDAREGSRIVAFGAAVQRERLWFLSMLFVLPEAQAGGVGRALLARILPRELEEFALATGTDSAQPISNALYSSYGIVPRMPLLYLSGTPDRPEAFPALPSGISATRFEEVVGAASDGAGHGALAAIIDDIDRELAGAAHPEDHRFLRGEDRHGWLYRGPDGWPLGYGYASESGRVGPVAVRDEDLLAPVLGHVLGGVHARGSYALWIPGHADRAIVPALAAGLRLDQFPILLCWSRPFADFRRYLPISPGLL